MIICPNCNTYLDDNARFCSNCGTQFIVQEQSQPQAYDPNAYAQQEAYQQQNYDPNAYQQQAYDPSAYQQQPAPAPQPKKKGKALIIAIVAVVLIILAAIGFFAQKILQAKDGGANNEATKKPENSNSVIEDMPTLIGNDIFAGERFNEMVWGYYEFENYQYGSSSDATQEFRQDMKYVTYEDEYSEKTISALPYSMHFGLESHFSGTFSYEGEYYEAYTEKGKAMFRKAFIAQYGDMSEENFQKIEEILNLSIVEMGYVNENGGTYSITFAYEIEGNKILLYQASVDEEYNLTKSEKPVFEYEFLHDGGKLMLASNGVKRDYKAYGLDATDTSLSFSGYAINDENQYDDLDGLSVYQYDDDDQPTVYVQLSGGESPIDPVMTFDKATGNFTISWEQRWIRINGSLEKLDDPTSISGTIVPFADYGFNDYSGFIMIIDGQQYRYIMSEDEYEERLNDLTAGGNLSGSQLEEVANTKRNLLAELEQAFKDAGISVDVDYNSGKIALEANFLFDTNSYELSADGQSYLDAFMGVYTSVILKEEYSAYISKIVVEGHTDTHGSYSLNQTLSQNRADAVAQRCIANNPQIAGVIQSVGCSYDYPVYNEDGTVNMEASRRVTFSFVFVG